MDDHLKTAIARVAAMLRACGAGEVYVFGSVARGRPSASSDVDLAVSGLQPDKFIEALGRAMQVLERPVDLIDLDEDTPFTRYLRREGDLQRVA